jgi:SOS response regulatory protein OraA/RecX
VTNEPEEVRRLVEAIEAFEAIEDDEACAAAVTQALGKWPDHHSKLRELRQKRVQSLKAQGKTWEEIGKLLGGISAARAQQIGAGLRGSKRPPKKDGSEE